MRKQLTAATIAAVAALSIGTGAALASTGDHPHGKSDPVAASRDSTTRGTSRDRASLGPAGLDRISHDRTGHDRAASGHTTEHGG